MIVKTNKSSERTISQRWMVTKFILTISFVFSFLLIKGQHRNFDEMSRLVTVKPKEMKVYEPKDINERVAREVKFLRIRGSESSTSEVCQLLKIVPGIEYCHILGSDKLDMDSVMMTMKNLKKLAYLCVEHANFIPKHIILLKNLKWLGFINGNIEVLPSGLYSLKKLRLLNIGYIYGHLVWGNDISEIPSGISKLKKLNYFFMHSNPIEVIPNEFCKLRHLIAIGTNVKATDIRYPDCLKGKIEFSE